MIKLGCAAKPAYWRLAARAVPTGAHADFCNCSLWEEPFCPQRYDSRWSDRIRPCPSAAFFHRSRAASRLGLRQGGDGGCLISPISTLDATLLLFLGELSGRVLRRPEDGRSGLVGVEVQGEPERRSRAAAARLLAALNSGPYSLPNMNSTGLRCRPSGVGLWVEPEVTARSRNPTSSSVRIAPRTRASVSPRAVCPASSRRSIGKAESRRLVVDQNRPRNVARAKAAS